MKSLCTCAALAVATAFAHGRFADALLRSNGLRTSEEKVTTVQFNALVDDCAVKISAFRNLLAGEAEKYVKNDEISEGQEITYLTKHLADKKCADLDSGDFDHFVSLEGDGDGRHGFVITAKKPGDESEWESGSDCRPALEQWRKGFSDLNGKQLLTYKYAPPSRAGREGVKTYSDSKAAALASLLQKGKKKIACGTLNDCSTAGFLLCYLKPVGEKEDPVPVDPKLWRALEAEHNVRPKLQLPDKNKGIYELDAVNEVRRAVELDEFKVPQFPESNSEMRSDKSDTLQPAIEKYLYGLKCDDLSKPNLSSEQPDEKDFTVIYYIKDVEGEATNVKTPTLQDAVDHWKTGFEKLQYKRPPAFKKGEPKREQVLDAEKQATETSNIYNDSAVAGYASIMADGEHQMACVIVSGCEKSNETVSELLRESKKTSKSGLICVIHKATLTENVRPISQKTWNTIMKKAGHPIPDFKKLDSSANCLQEMNAVRTQEKLGLKPFVPKTPATATAPAARSGSQTELVLSSVMESVTCKAIGGEGAESSRTTGAETTSAGPWLEIADDKSSLMYHTYTGDEKTCSAAVEAWKKGFEKFAAAPPAYKATDPVYQDAAARNFVSLISEGEKTEVTCYETNCTKNGIVCELSPAALREDQTPVSADTWTKYTAIVAEGEGQGAGAGAGAGAGGNAQPESSGVAGYSKAALVGTVVMTLAGGVFFM